jgi:SPX domain protein involved in polyphosphate accumulation
MFKTSATLLKQGSLVIQGDIVAENSKCVLNLFYDILACLIEGDKPICISFDLSNSVVREVVNMNGNVCNNF